MSESNFNGEKKQKLCHLNLLMVVQQLSRCKIPSVKANLSQYLSYQYACIECRIGTIPRVFVHDARWL